MPVALQGNISIHDFWNMSIKEIKQVLDAYSETKKREAKTRSLEYYSLAVMITSFIGSSLNGKEIPSYENLFPEKEPDVDPEIIRIREQFKDFANMANKHREAK